MAYVLEDEREFQRLEKQSQFDAYDYRKELAEIDLNVPNILDAGCGSGIVARYVATQSPDSKVLGIDASSTRLNQASAASQLDNLRFEEASLLNLKEHHNSFDLIYSRFVIEHIPAEESQKAIDELARCLKPGGLLCLIDIDGLLLNIAPLSKSLENSLKQINEARIVDLNVGRKLPSMLISAGLDELHWKIEPMVFQGQSLLTEAELISERFQLANDALTQVLGSSKASADFQIEYLNTLRRNDCVLFYEKFIATARKPRN